MLYALISKGGIISWIYIYLYIVFIIKISAKKVIKYKILHSQGLSQINPKYLVTGKPLCLNLLDPLVLHRYLLCLYNTGIYLHFCIYIKSYIIRVGSGVFHSRTKISIEPQMVSPRPQIFLKRGKEKK